MKTPLWTKLAILLLVAGMGGVGFYCSQLSSKLDDTLSKMHAMEEDMAYLARADRGAQKKAASGEASTEAIKELDDRIGALMLKAKANSKRLDSLEAGDFSDLGLSEMLGGGAGAGAGKDTPVFAERGIGKVGDRLELTPLQQQRVANILDEAKEDAYAILEAAKQDDPEFLEAVGGILRGGGDLNEKARKILPKLFASNVPGTDESYFSALLDIRHNAIYGFRDVLSQDQRSQFKGMNMDIFSIRTDYNPFSTEGQENP